MDDRMIALVRATLSLEDLNSVIEDVMSQEGFSGENDDGTFDDEPCGYHEADCGSRWCEMCGCLQYKRQRLKRAVAMAEALWPDMLAAERERNKPAS